MFFKNQNFDLNIVLESNLALFVDPIETFARMMSFQRNAWRCQRKKKIKNTYSCKLFQHSTLTNLNFSLQFHLVLSSLLNANLFDFIMAGPKRSSRGVSKPRMSPDVRAQIIAFAIQGMKKKKIAEKVGCSRGCVHYTLNKFKRTGKVIDLPSPNGKSVLSQVQVNKIVERSKQYSFASAREIRDKEKLSCSVSTVKRVLKKYDLNGYRAVTRQLLSATHMAERVKFAQGMLGKDWKNIIFSDEKSMQNYYNARPYVRRPRGQAFNERYIIRMDKTRKFKLNLWGYITPTDFKLYQIPDKHDSESYVEVLEKAKIPSIAEKKKFMQDNARIHTSKLTTGYLEKSKVELLPWPARSPDLNPIENVWAEMQKSVYRQILLKSPPKTRDQLFLMCKLGFETACKKNLVALYNSMPNRVQKVIELKGKTTKYLNKNG